jgi:hypothetical protein
MKNRGKTGLLGLLLSGAFALSHMTSVLASESSGNSTPSLSSVSSEGSIFRKDMAELAGEIEKMPQGSRRGRFAWTSDRLERMSETKEVSDELIRYGKELVAAARNEKEASAALPWFERGRWEGLRMVDNGRIGLGFVGTTRGVSLVSFFDMDAEQEYLAGTPLPFWSLALSENAGGRRELNSGEGLREFRAKESSDGAGRHSVELEWVGQKEDGSLPVRVSCEVVLAADKATWRMKVDNSSETWSIRTIVFPQISLGIIGDSEEDDFLVVPHGSGELKQQPLKNEAKFSGRYPGGWCSMQFFSHYDDECGLYLGIHDPLASTKDFTVTSQDRTGVQTTIAWPAPDAGLPGNDWESSGEAVFQAFRGDWFDAAQIYKEWVSKKAEWWPQGETPEWFEEIAVWAQTGGGREQVVGPTKKFAEYMGLPTALHWYNWHQVPFDDDYPHYFPYKEGFPAGVKELQEAGVRVMPYINGRLWDTDLEDFKNHAVRFCTKDEKGEPYIETYGSGQKLCPMCPTTELWQRTVQELVTRLVSPEVNVDAVYIDQVAAATPRLCFDRTHGHPLGGGHWWNTQGYWPMLTALQQELSTRYPDKVLTTECNAEPYTHVFDGYLTWHFQYQDQIPLFAAVYGGKIQLFSRAYQGDSWKGLAMRMKTGQALVFGEQLGWISPGVISDAEAAAFLRRMARLRYALRDYLARGEMARSPVMTGDIPTVTADWQWWGKRLVTTPAILSGAWRAKDGRLALIFVNVSDSEQVASLEFAAERYGMEKSPFLLVTSRSEDGASEPVRETHNFRRPIKLGPCDAIAFEILGGK